jgi:hypothetical protein
MKKVLSLVLLFYTALKTAPSPLEEAYNYQKNEDFAQAIALYKQIIQHDPNDINAHFHSAFCHLALGNKEESIAAYLRVLELDPRAIAAQYNLGYAYKTFGDLNTAITLYKKVIQENPDYEPAHLALGFAYITQGNFSEGWKQHQRYLQRYGKNGEALRKLLAEDDIAYKKILLRPEGGLGDTLNFIRYAQALKNRYADVIVVCQKQLIPLLSRCTFIDHLLSSDSVLPEYDADATLMSLPAIFNDNNQTVPQTIPYIFPDPALIDYWAEHLADDNNFKVGICWQVDVHNDQSKLPIARRGYPLESFAMLRELPNISFYSLQKYDGLEQLAASPQLPLHVFENIDEKSGPFSDTAALIKNLDLVITVDTAIAHLAGALGINVWLLLPYATADWRWIHGKKDSYWYPTMRIFKQHEAFGYEKVIEEVKKELLHVLSQR